MLEQKNIDIDKFNAVQESLSKEDAKGGKTPVSYTHLTLPTR